MQGRREFLKRMFMVVGVVALSRWFSGTAAAQQPGGAKPQPKPLTQRPPGTCGGYNDTNGDGVCERSVPKGQCKAMKCPANTLNPAWATARQMGAPAGSCAIWIDLEKKGYCKVCDREQNPCLFAGCPDHKDHKKSVS